MAIILIQGDAGRDIRKNPFDFQVNPCIVQATATYSPPPETNKDEAKQAT